MKNQSSQQMIITLRGGGCGSSTVQTTSSPIELKKKIHSELPSILLSMTQIKVKNLKSKTLTIGDKAVQDEYFQTINWLDVNEYWYQMIPDDKYKMTQSIKLLQFILLDILEIVEQIIDGCRFIAYSLIRVSNNFSRIMVIYYTQNRQNFLDLQLSNNLKEKISDIKKIIKGFGETSLYFNGLQYESGITEACINICPVDNPEGKELGLNALKQIVMSAASMSPSDGLFSSLADLAFFGLKTLIQKYKESNFKEMMTKCLFIEQFKWTIVNSIHQEKFSIKQTFNTLSKFYNNEIKYSKTWEVKYCWMKANHWIMGYRIQVTQQIFNSPQIDRLDQYWHDLIQQQIIQIINKSDHSIGAIVDENQLMEFTSNNPIYLKLIVKTKSLNRIKDKLLNGSEGLPKILEYSNEFTHTNEQEQGEMNKKILQAQKEFQYFETGLILGNFKQIQTQINSIMINQNDLNELRHDFNQSTVDQDLVNDISQLGSVILQQVQELHQLFIKTRLHILQCGYVTDNFISIIQSDYQLNRQYQSLTELINLQGMLNQLEAVVIEYYTSESSDQIQRSQYLDQLKSFIKQNIDTIKTYEDQQRINIIAQKLQQLIDSQNIMPEQIRKIILISNQLIKESTTNQTFFDIIQLVLLLESSQHFVPPIQYCINVLQEMIVVYSKIKFVKFQFLNETTDYQGISFIKINSIRIVCQYNNIQRLFQKIMNNNVTVSHMCDLIQNHSQTLCLTTEQNKYFLNKVVEFEWTKIENYSLIVDKNTIEVSQDQQLQNIEGILNLQNYLIQQQEYMIEHFQYLLLNIKYIDRTKQEDQKQSDLLSNMKLILQETQSKLKEVKQQQKQFNEINEDRLIIIKEILQDISTKDENQQFKFAQSLIKLEIQQWSMKTMNDALYKKLVQISQEICPQTPNQEQDCEVNQGAQGEIQVDIQSDHEIVTNEGSQKIQNNDEQLSNPSANEELDNEVSQKQNSKALENSQQSQDNDEQVRNDSVHEQQNNEIVPDQNSKQPSVQGNPEERDSNSEHQENTNLLQINNNDEVNLDQGEGLGNNSDPDLDNQEVEKADQQQDSKQENLQRETNNQINEQEQYIDLRTNQDINETEENVSENPLAKQLIDKVNSHIDTVIQLIDFHTKNSKLQEIEDILTTEYLANIQNCSLSETTIKELTYQFKQFNNTNSKNFMQINLISAQMISNLKLIDSNIDSEITEQQDFAIQSKTGQLGNESDYKHDKSLITSFLKQKYTYQNYSSHLHEILKWYNNQDKSRWRTLASFQLDDNNFLINQTQSNFNSLISLEFLNSLKEQQQLDSENEPIRYFEVLLEKSLEISKNISYEQVKQCLEQNKDNLITRESLSDTRKDEWRFRECQIFNILIVQFKLTPQPESCYNRQLILHKAIETDNRLQKIFQSSDFILQQQQALEKHWKQQSSTVQTLISRQLLKLQQLQKSIQSQQPGSERDQLLLEHETLETQIDHQIENVSSIGNSLGITIVFIKDLKKELLIIQDQLKDLTSKLNDMAQDIKYLIGKSPQQLLEVRMEKILKQKIINDARSVYVQLYTMEMEDLDIGKEAQLPTPLSNGDDEQNGEIDEFIEHEKQTSLLVHGPAGSGKSTAAKKVEEYLWIRYQKQQIRNWKVSKEKIIIPIFIQLPTLKDPKFNALQETLKSSEYHFNDKQILDLQEYVQSGRVQLFIIMDSYDELSREYLEQNLNITNKFEQWCENSNYKILNTTRSEIFLGKTEYRAWFSSQSANKKVHKSNFKEIRILSFNEKQRYQFFDQFCKLSLKQALIDIYDILLDQKSLKMDTALVIKDLWEQIQLRLSNANFRQEYLLNSEQIDMVIQLIEAQKENKIDLSKDQKAHLTQQLSQLWSQQMYVHNINQLSIMDLVKTPYMTNIVVSVLPKLIEEFSSQDHLKPLFLRNIRFRLEEQQTLNLKQSVLNEEQELKSDSLQNWKSLINQADAKTESQIISQISIEIWNVLIESKSLVNYKITNPNIQFQIYSKLLQELRSIAQKNRELNLSYDLNRIYTNLLNVTLQVENLQQLQQSKVELQQLNDQYDILPDTYSKGLLQVLQDYDLIFDSIAKNKPSSYDFYKMFISEFIAKQIQKLSYKQQNVQVHKFLSDSYEYAQTLGTLMTQYELTSIEYVQKGIIDKKSEDGFQQMIFQLFDDNSNNSQLKAQIRTSIPLKVRGNQYSFYHKSIQEYLFAKSFLDLLDYMQPIQDLQIEQLFIYRKQKEYVEFSYKNEDSYEDFRKLNKLKRDKIKRIIQYLEYLNVNHINQKNYSQEFFIGAINFIVNKIQCDPELLKITMILLKISKIDKNFQICTSNCLHILIKAQIVFIGQDLSGIFASNISIQSVVFREVDFSHSCFNKVNINGINLVSANISDCNWQKLITNELPVITVGSQVNSVAYSSDGKYIVSGSEDGNIRIWDAQSGEQIGNTLIGPGSEITKVTYSSDGELITSVDINNTIRIWNTQSCTQIEDTLIGNIDGVLSIVYSPGGKFIASGSKDNRFRIWDTQSREQLTDLLIEQTFSVFSLSPNGKFIVLGSEDGTIRIWDTQQGTQFGATLTGHTEKINVVTYSPNGEFIASGSEDNTIRICNTFTGKQIGDTLTGHGYEVTSVAYSSDGKFIASGSNDNTVRIWDAKSGKQIGDTLSGHNYCVLSVAFSPDGKFIVSGCKKGTIRIWDAQSGKQIANTLPGHTDQVLSVAYSPNGKFIASGSLDNTIRIWDTQSGKQVGDALTGHNSTINSVAYSSDGKFIASGSADQTVMIWDAQSGKQIGDTFTGHTFAVNSVAFSPDAKFIASGSDDQTVRILDAQSGIQIRDPLCDQSSMILEKDLERLIIQRDETIRSVRAVAYSPDGKFIASGCMDKAIRIWDIESGTLFAEILTGHPKKIWALAYSPDCKLIASGGCYNTVKIWNAQTCQLFVETDDIIDITSAAFSPDSKFIATGGFDTRVRFFDVQSGKEIGDALEGHTDVVKQVAFSPDGKFIASGGFDTILIMDNAAIHTSFAKISSKTQQLPTEANVKKYFHQLNKQV